MIKKIANLKGRIDCPKCFSLLEWDNAKDIKVSNGNRYIICPECGQSLVLKKGKDYWEEDNSSGGGSSDLSTANVTISGFPEGSMIPVFGAFAVDQQGATPPSGTSPLIMQGNGNYTVVMYKGSASLTAAIYDNDYVITSVTGDIEIMNGAAFVHGDGTITFAHS